ncbi:spore protease YyaC [Jeotgalibacillus haloalkalitolerans]|uniref:Spore protease YyaC n=1 Tax=Jeotgalibacillus haloalkalitolerans TaxID=3104292 RepID=A0ABU5KH77_9BACL|nr:spore protease YyaC [Jeotgalibacillus sp. HH7-29]MDZ5710603.1 spore protease YyaC [Jeotgalibacillus sp. HH7-29]
MNEAIPPQFTDTSCRSHLEDHMTPHRLAKTLASKYPIDRPIVYVCIGTDRSTGDSLGPLTGSLLEKRKLPFCDLYGTLKDPVHALNLADTAEKIRLEYDNPFIVAIDACLGQFRNIGYIEVGEGPIFPGAGVQKQLPPIGDVHITGIVNAGGFMEHAMLQNTRLYLVNEMASKITDAIHYSNILLRKKIAKTHTLHTGEQLSQSHPQ